MYVYQVPQYLVTRFTQSCIKFHWILRQDSPYCPPLLTHCTKYKVIEAFN